MTTQEILFFFSENKDSIVTIAALGALMMTAITATLSLFGTIAAKKIDERIKRQESIRKLLEDGMIGIGENMHEILSSADILIKKFKLKAHKNDPSLEASIANYKNKIDNNKKHLIKAKTIYRYKLYGLEDGLSIIARSADWVKGLRDNLFLAEKILKEADKIRLIIDKAIINCYRNGDYPSNFVRLRISYHSWRIRRMWEARKIRT